MTVPASLLSKYYDPESSIEVRRADGSRHNVTEPEAIYRLIAAGKIEGKVLNGGRLRYLRLTVSIDQAIDIIVADQYKGRALSSVMSAASQEVIRQWEISPVLWAHKLNVQMGVA